MICKNCPFGEYFYIPIWDEEGIDCYIDDEEHDLNDECFFPETIMEKGV